MGTHLEEPLCVAQRKAIIRMLARIPPYDTADATRQEVLAGGWRAKFFGRLFRQFNKPANPLACHLSA